MDPLLSEWLTENRARRANITGASEAYAGDVGDLTIRLRPGDPTDADYIKLQTSGRQRKSTEPVTIYAFIHPEGTALGGRACWKTTVDVAMDDTAGSPRIKLPVGPLPRAESYSIKVVIGGRSIAGSPFRIKVLPRKTTVAKLCSLHNSDTSAPRYWPAGAPESIAEAFAAHLPPASATDTGAEAEFTAGETSTIFVAARDQHGNLRGASDKFYVLVRPVDDEAIDGVAEAESAGAPQGVELTYRGDGTYAASWVRNGAGLYEAKAYLNGEPVRGALLCRVRPGPLCLPMCEASGRQLRTIAGAEGGFIIRARDKVGNLCGVGGARWRVRVAALEATVGGGKASVSKAAAKAAADAEAGATVTDLGDGRYRVTLSAARSGRYAVRPLLRGSRSRGEGDPLPGAPFTLTVQRNAEATVETLATSAAVVYDGTADAAASEQPLGAASARKAGGAKGGPREKGSGKGGGKGGGGEGEGMLVLRAGERTLIRLCTEPAGAPPPPEPSAEELAEMRRRLWVRITRSATASAARAESGQVAPPSPAKEKAHKGATAGGGSSDGSDGGDDGSSEGGGSADSRSDASATPPPASTPSAAPPAAMVNGVDCEAVDGIAIHSCELEKGKLVVSFTAGVASRGYTLHAWLRGRCIEGAPLGFCVLSAATYAGTCELRPSLPPRPSWVASQAAPADGMPLAAHVLGASPASLASRLVPAAVKPPCAKAGGAGGGGGEDEGSLPIGRAAAVLVMTHDGSIISEGEIDLFAGQRARMYLVARDRFGNARHEKEPTPGAFRVALLPSRGLGEGGEQAEEGGEGSGNVGRGLEAATETWEPAAPPECVIEPTFAEGEASNPSLAPLVPPALTRNPDTDPCAVDACPQARQACITSRVAAPARGCMRRVAGSTASPCAARRWSVCAPAYSASPTVWRPARACASPRREQRAAS